MVGVPTPVETLNFNNETLAAYLELSEKNASSAVTRLRRSDFMAVRYALPFVFANLGIAIAAKMPMMTTTINSSIRVKPLRIFCMSPLRMGRGWYGGHVYYGLLMASTAPCDTSLLTVVISVSCVMSITPVRVVRLASCDESGIVRRVRSHSILLMVGAKLILL